MRLQTILFPSQEICEVEELYFHRQDEKILVNGYFNLFSIDKWKKYTGLNTVELCLKARGYSQISIMCNEQEIESHALEAGEKKEYKFSISLSDKAGMLWFFLTSQNDEKQFFQGSYETKAESKNEIGLGIVICTFKREEYIRRNVAILQRLLTENEGQELSKRLHIYIVDNGHTLEKKELEDSYVHVIPNKNVGGSGGFTRGLIQAERDSEKYHLSHVIFMDDDIVIEPDALVRTYAILALLKDEYKNKGVGGAHLRLDFPYIQHASGESWSPRGIISKKQGLDLRKYKACRKNEEEVREEFSYNGWWYCCFPLKWAGKDNLPLPMFIHGDDMEYGVRNSKYGFIYLNGIAVWHSGNEHRKPSYFEYYETRNDLILRSLHSPQTTSRDVKKWVLKRIIVNVFRYRYSDVEMTYRGAEDFCKGVKWLAEQNGEKLHKEILNKGIVMNPVTELTSDAKVIHEIKNYRLSKDGTDIYTNLENSKKMSRKILMTLNGWILPAREKKLTALPIGASPFEFYRKKRVLLFEPETQKGTIGRKSYQSCLKAIICCLKTWRIIDKSYNQAAHDYRKNGRKLMSLSFWERYLEI